MDSWRVSRHSILHTYYLLTNGGNMAVYKVNVDEEISMIQLTRLFVEAESEQEAIDKVTHWIQANMASPGEDLVDIETVDTYVETIEHTQWFKESISCEGLRVTNE